MKKTAILLSCVLCISSVFAQLPPLGCTGVSKWAVSAGQSSNYAEGNSIATDNQGNIYVAGSFRSVQPNSTMPGYVVPAIMFGTTTYPAVAGAGADHFFVAKYNNCGDFMWVAYGDYQQYQYHYTNRVRVDVDASGNSVYVSSALNSDMRVRDGVGVTTGVLFTSGNSTFILKFNGTTGAYQNGIKASYTGSNPFTVNNSGLFQIKGSMVYKYDLNLNLVAFLNLSSVNISNVQEIDSDSKDLTGNFYVSGPFYNTISTTIPITAVSDFYILKISPALAPMYAQKGGAIEGALGQVNATPTDMYVENSKIYVTGYYATAGTGTIFTPPITGNGIFVAKFADLGATATVLWGVRANTTNPPSIAANDVDVYIAGRTFVEHFSSVTGTVMAAPAIAGDAGDICFSLPNNAFFITGSYSSSLALNNTLTAQGLNDMYTARLNAVNSYYRLGDARPSKTGGFTLYPNPSGQRSLLEFTAYGKEQVSITILDITGKVVRELSPAAYEAGKHSLELDLSGIESGVYFVRMINAGTSTTQKFIKL